LQHRSLDGDARATRALIVVHGLLRNANVYERTGEEAPADTSKFGLAPDTLRWDRKPGLMVFPLWGR
jgi:hypothetical protein